MATDETHESFYAQTKVYNEAENLWQSKVFTQDGTDTGASGMGLTREAAEAEAWAAFVVMSNKETAENAPSADDGVDTMAPVEDADVTDVTEDEPHVGGGPKPSKSRKSK